MHSSSSARKTVPVSLVLATLCAISSAAQAQSAGMWLFKGGINTISPSVSSGDLSASSLPGTKVDVKSATSVIATATYLFTDHVSAEAYAGLPYEHEVVGDGALANVGKLGTVKQVSPTVFAQYRFRPAESVFRPYIGLGLTYAYFYGEEGSAALTALSKPGCPPTRLQAESAWGLSPQVGLTYQINPHWFIDASIVKTFLKTTDTLSTGQKIDVKLDPLSINASLAYRF
jgi:outer membrane protein